MYIKKLYRIGRGILGEMAGGVVDGVKVGMRVWARRVEGAIDRGLEELRGNDLQNTNNRLQVTGEGLFGGEFMKNVYGVGSEYKGREFVLVVLDSDLSAVRRVPFDLDRKVMVYADREWVEHEPMVRQVIPYGVMVSEHGRVAVFVRRGSEERLHGKVTLGVGGHIRLEDALDFERMALDLEKMPPNMKAVFDKHVDGDVEAVVRLRGDRAWRVVLRRALGREMKEEIGYSHGKWRIYPQMIRLVDSEVNRVHVGIPILLEGVEERNFESADGEMVFGGWASVNELEDLYRKHVAGELEIEEWSLWVLEHIFDMNLGALGSSLEIERRRVVNEGEDKEDEFREKVEIAKRAVKDMVSDRGGNKDGNGGGEGVVMGKDKDNEKDGPVVNTSRAPSDGAYKVVDAGRVVGSVKLETRPVESDIEREKREAEAEERKLRRGNVKLKDLIKRKKRGKRPPVKTEAAKIEQGIIEREVKTGVYRGDVDFSGEAEVQRVGGAPVAPTRSSVSVAPPLRDKHGPAGELVDSDGVVVETGEGRVRAPGGYVLNVPREIEKREVNMGDVQVTIVSKVPKGAMAIKSALEENERMVNEVPVLRADELEDWE